MKVELEIKKVVKGSPIQDHLQRLSFTEYVEFKKEVVKQRGPDYWTKIQAWPAHSVASIIQTALVNWANTDKGKDYWDNLFINSIKHDNQGNKNNRVLVSRL